MISLVLLDLLHNSKSQKSAERRRMATSIRKDVDIVVWGHTKVVYTWPLLIFGYLFCFLSLCGLGGEWMSWLYTAALLLVLTVLTVDVRRDAAIAIGAIIGLLLVICFMFWWFTGINMILGPLRWAFGFNNPYAPASHAATSIGLTFLWVAEYVYSYFNLRVRFYKGEVFHLKPGLEHTEGRLEEVVIKVTVDDTLESWMWGGKVEITSRPMDFHKTLENVLSFRKVYLAIRKPLPSDRSDPDDGS